MDELLAEFLTEAGEGLGQLDVDLVRFEQDPNNADMLNSIFRLVHTVKGTCGFLGLNRLAKLAHAAETLMGQYRDGSPVTVDGVSVILASIDRIKQILTGLEHEGVEPRGSDADLIERLEVLALDGAAAMPQVHYQGLASKESDVPGPSPVQATLEELERAWRAAPGPDQRAPLNPHNGNGASDLNGKDSHARAQTVRVSVDTLEHLMTTVSELCSPAINYSISCDARAKASSSRPCSVGHGRAAGRHHEGPHAADRQRLAEAAATGAGSSRSSSTRRSTSK
jgi:two-component system chemotaxis sensor kinase CheA